MSVLPAAEFNSLVDELKNIITSSGQALTGADVTQIAKGIANYVMNGNFFTDSGVANAYLLNVVGAKLAPTTYTNGFTVLFKVGNTNTGASSVNVGGLGVKSIKKNNGADDLDAGDLSMGSIVELVYDLSGDYFELTRTEFIAGDFLRRDQTSNVTVGYTTTAFSLGNSGTGTVTPLIANGHIQTLTINGNFTLAAPTDIESGIIEIEATNTAPGGFVITTSAYTVIQNDYNNASGAVNLIRILKIGSISYLSIRPATLVSNVSVLAPVYNAVINGGMDVWQRNVSFTNPINNTYTADRWFNAKLVTTAAYNYTRSTLVPPVDNNTPLLNYSLAINVTASDASVTATKLAMISQRIEGYNYKPLAQRSMTLSFWVRSSITGTYCVSVCNSNRDRCFIREYTINNANTWERKVISIDPSPALGTWNYLNGIGLEVNFVLMAGSNFQGSAGTWLTTASLATANQTNFLGVNGATFNLTAVQLETGSNASPFALEEFTEIFNKCQRYFEKTYNLNLFPGNANGRAAQISSQDEGAYYMGNGITTTAPQPLSASSPNGRYYVRKRSLPSAQTYNPSNGNAGNARNITANANILSNILAGETSILIGFPGGGTLGNAYELHYTIDSEL